MFIETYASFFIVIFLLNVIYQHMKKYIIQIILDMEINITYKWQWQNFSILWYFYFTLFIFYVVNFYFVLCRFLRVIFILT